jgi:hypothetical protein
MDVNQRIFNVLNSQKIFNKLGLQAIRIIRKRTRKAYDVKGNIFKSYSQGYLKKRAKAGLENPEKVTLEFSRVNSMLETIGYTYALGLGGAESSVEVYITDPLKEQIAYYHNISGAGKGKVIREFWGIESDKEVEQLNNVINASVREALVKEIGDILVELNELRDNN